MPELEDFAKDSQSYKDKIFYICGINSLKMTKGVDKQALTIKKYY